MVVVQIALTQVWPIVGGPVQLDDTSGKCDMEARVVKAVMAQLVAEPAGGQSADVEPEGILVWTVT